MTIDIIFNVFKVFVDGNAGSRKRVTQGRGVREDTISIELRITTSNLSSGIMRPSWQFRTAIKFVNSLCQRASSPEQ